MAPIHISKDPPEKTPAAFACNPQLKVKTKTIHGHTWNPTEKYWSIPNTGRIMERLAEIDTHDSNLSLSRVWSSLDNLDLGRERETKISIRQQGADGAATARNIRIWKYRHNAPCRHSERKRSSSPNKLGDKK